MALQSQHPTKRSTTIFKFWKLCSVQVSSKGPVSISCPGAPASLSAALARIITNSSFDAPGGPLIEEMGCKTIDELITCESKTMVFKSPNQLAPEYLCGLFTRNSLCSSYSLRSAGTDLRLPKKRSSNGQRCFSYRGAKLWNGLSAESKQATSLYSFKKTI